MSENIRLTISKEFYDIIVKFIKDFEEQNYIELDPTEVTKIIAKKIEDSGGLNV